MITAIDSNILIDIFSEDKIYDLPAEEALRYCLRGGAVVACGVVLVEVAPHFPAVNILHDALSLMRVQTQTLSMSTYLEAASAWKEYRRSGGSRSRVVADFLIGAHALVECDRLLTRDRGFYRHYFKKLKIVEPNRTSK